MKKKECIQELKKWSGGGEGGISEEKAEGGE